MEEAGGLEAFVVGAINSCIDSVTFIAWVTILR